MVDLFKNGEICTLRGAAFLSNSELKKEQLVTVEYMEHRHGHNRYVLVNLHNRAKSQVLVYPVDLTRV